MAEFKAALREIPAIDKLLQAAAGDDGFAGLERKAVTEALRAAVDEARKAIMSGGDRDVSIKGILDAARRKLAVMLRPTLRRVINATGVVLHTNLGRAPLSARAQASVVEVMNGYSTLEYDLVTGERGSRYSHIRELICRLTGAEDALAVNNNAAAVVLAVSAVGAGREVIVSRGELVEVGGSFRIPDVISQSGARLVEVGTTNKTHIADYRAAITPDTAALLKVHTSNYRIVGFTAQPDAAELVALGEEFGLPVIEDLGSGTLLPVEAGDWREPSVAERVAAGFSIVTFSGDKLFGAGQAGIIAGKKVYIDKMKKHPLLRAFRIDKLSLASLEGTLIDYAWGNPVCDIPVQRMLRADPEVLKTSAARLAAILKEQAPDWSVRVTPTASPAGGGSLPAVNLAGYGVSVSPRTVSAAAAEIMLRKRDVPVIARIQDNRLLFDVRCLREEDFAEIGLACAEIAKGESM
ncbi:MAG: L-seryl-tRNA(Sec) selenium transferase [Negativicutes bacterium]|nr:L-seryl-tRNA(Sec) selenium transferase [Negativicutes bacterium]